MKRKNVVISLIVVLILITIGGIIFGGKTIKEFIFSSGFDISIENQTSSKIGGLKISYMNANKDIEVPNIESNSKVKLNINTIENFSENSMKLFYFDKSGNRHEEIIVGYFEKGYSGKSKVEIEGVDALGRLVIKVTEEF